MKPLKYLSSLWGTLKISLVNFEANLILTWPINCMISTATNQPTTFAATDTKLYVLVVNLSMKNYCNN